MPRQRFDSVTKTWYDVPDPEEALTKKRFHHEKSIPQSRQGALPCQHCGSADMEDLPAESWTSEHKCRACGSEHRVTYGDAMGGTYLDTVEWTDGATKEGA